MGSLAGCCFGDSVNRFNIMRDKERERGREREKKVKRERKRERYFMEKRKEEVGLQQMLL